MGSYIMILRNRNGIFIETFMDFYHTYKTERLYINIFYYYRIEAFKLKQSKILMLFSLHNIAKV